MASCQSCWRERLELRSGRRRLFLPMSASVPRAIALDRIVICFRRYHVTAAVGETAAWLRAVLRRVISLCRRFETSVLHLTDVFSRRAASLTLLTFPLGGQQAYISMIFAVILWFDTSFHCMHGPGAPDLCWLALELGLRGRVLPVDGSPGPAHVVGIDAAVLGGDFICYCTCQPLYIRLRSTAYLQIEACLSVLHLPPRWVAMMLTKAFRGVFAYFRSQRRATSTMQVRIYHDIWAQVPAGAVV